MLGVSQKPRCVTRKTEANLDHFLLHVDTNDLDSDRSPDLIAKSIVNVVSSLIKSHKHDVTISNITQNGCFISKLSEVNTCLTEFCFEKIFLIYHSNTLKSQHLNESKLYLNRSGTSKALDSQSRSPVFKTTGWLQCRLSLSSFRDR